MPIVKLTYHGNVSTGFWIGPRAVLTAGHGLPNVDSRIGAKLTGRSLDIGGDGESASVVVHPESDVALIMFDTRQVEQFFPLAILEAPDHRQLHLRVSGYPARSDQLSLWDIDTPRLKKSETGIVQRYNLWSHGIDTGCSGSPVLYTRDDVNFAVGILQKSGEDAARGLADSMWVIADWLETEALVPLTRMTVGEYVESTGSADESKKGASFFEGATIVGDVQVGDRTYVKKG